MDENNEAQMQLSFVIYEGTSRLEGKTTLPETWYSTCGYLKRQGDKVYKHHPTNIYAENCSAESQLHSASRMYRTDSFLLQNIRWEASLKAAEGTCQAKLLNHCQWGNSKIDFELQIRYGLRRLHLVFL